MAESANLVTIRARSGKSEALGEALRALVSQTREEPGSAACALHRSSTDADVWMVYERWKGDDAFAAHMQQPYVATFLAQFDDLAAGLPEILPFDYIG